MNSRAISTASFRLIVAAALSLPAFGQTVLRTAPVPRDPLEIVTGRTEVANTAAGRQAALQLVSRARESYAMRKAGTAYNLQVSFTVDSGGQTDYDGTWQMDDIVDPNRGLRWTATASAGYTTTQIASNGKFYGEGTSNVIPLRLQEARAALLDPIPSAKDIDGDLIRTSTATFNGMKVTCVLLSAAGNAATATSARRWQEVEECIDPQTGLLQMHSQIPGRYYAYDYSNAPRLGDYVLPRKVLVSEAGKIVSTISVDRLDAIPPVDPGFFTPTPEMIASGPSTAMAGAQKIAGLFGPLPIRSGAKVRPVCVFGLVTPSGQLVEAHSLQPNDPNSLAALDAAKRIDFATIRHAGPATPGSRPQQYFVFIIERFVSK